MQLILATVQYNRVRLHRLTIMDRLYDIVIKSAPPCSGCFWEK